MDSELLELQARARLDALTKPPGSLGRLEELAVQFALIRGEVMPSPARKAMFIFCADHGVTAEDISPYPASVTASMVRNFVDGGAAINVMCRSLNIPAVIVDVGVRGPAIAGVENYKIAPGTKNFAVEPAMTRTQAEAVLEVGRSLAVEAGQSFDLTGLGEMGIGNTTTAVALLSAFTGRDASEIAGRGTGAPQEMVDRKIDVVRRAIALHKPAPDDGIGVLAALGGFEIGAIAGFILGAWSRRLPVVLDGFPCCARALVARAIQPDALSACIFAHLSAERGHGVLLNNLGAKPILDLGMRLGEGTGAALAIGIVDAAVRLYREMATFEETGMLCERPGATAR